MSLARGLNTRNARLETKARNLASNLRLGVGGKAVMKGIVLAAENQPCRYCGALMTLENMQVDHRDPLPGGSRGKLARAVGVTVADLEPVCRRCNGIKGVLPAVKFEKLMAFLRSDPVLHKHVLASLSRGRRAWWTLKGKGRR